jgi:hypothetical protein
MVTQQDLLEYIGRRPFQPFRVTLSGGETVDVTRTAQAVAMSRPMVWRRLIIGGCGGFNLRLDRVELELW